MCSSRNDNLRPTRKPTNLSLGISTLLARNQSASHLSIQHITPRSISFPFHYLLWDLNGSRNFFSIKFESIPLPMPLKMNLCIIRIYFFRYLVLRVYSACLSLYLRYIKINFYTNKNDFNICACYCILYRSNWRYILK